MIDIITNFIYKYRVKHIDIKLLDNYLTRRQYLIKILKFYKVEDLLPKKDKKYLRILTYFKSIKNYNKFMVDTFINNPVENCPPRTLFNTTNYSIYYTDFFIDNNIKLNEKESLIEFLDIYKKLVDIMDYYNISDGGNAYLIYKLLDHYLTNMEGIITRLITSNLTD